MQEPDESATLPDVASDIEHELTNSLASILGFSQVIRRDPSLPDDLRHSADLLIEEATRTQRIVQTLLDLARRRRPEAHLAATSPVDRAPDPGPAREATNVDRPSVLVLEDDPSFRVFLKKALTMLGYGVVVTSMGPEAVERATQDDPAILMCDHQLPGMSGIEVYEAIVATRPDLASRFVMMTGDVLEPALEAFAATHEMTRLGKPFDLDTLERTLRSVIDGSAQSRG